MSREIWKFELKTTENQQIDIPANSHILSLQLQGGIPHIWTMVNPDAPSSKMIIRLFLTGEQIEDHTRFDHIGTVQLNGYVLHYFKEN